MMCALQTHDPETAVALALSMAEQQSSPQVLPVGHAAHHHDTFKMVVVVRADLGMSAGKIAAQCVHAALAAYRQSQVRATPWLRAWESQGEATICLQCSGDDELQVLKTTERATCRLLACVKATIV
jgi:PTH2 family peptidyl-tRNA hydrolase